MRDVNPGSPKTNIPVTTSFYLDPVQKRKLTNRINRIIGQLNAIKREIQKGECADDLLIQLAAVRGALTRLTVKILETQLLDCARTCMRNGSTDDDEVLERITRALSIILRQGA